MSVLPAEAQAKKGTHFIAEANTGAAFGTGFSEGGVGLSTRLSLGFGGGFRGFSPRFYLVVAGRYGLIESQVNAGLSTNHIRRDLVDLSAGLRVLIPVRRLRFLFEATLGDSLVYSEARLNGVETYKADDERFAIYLATGLQYRFHKHVSAGLLAEWSLPVAREAQDFVGAVAGVKDDGGLHGWTSLSVTFVAHF